jgi:hypothetical protein
VAAEIAVSPLFLQVLTYSHVCSGRVVRTLDELEALRTCSVINGSLTIALNDANADFTSLYDIRAIQGLALDWAGLDFGFDDMAQLQDHSRLLEAV